MAVRDLPRRRQPGEQGTWSANRSTKFVARQFGAAPFAWRITVCDNTGRAARQFGLAVGEGGLGVPFVKNTRVIFDLCEVLSAQTSLPRSQWFSSLTLIRDQKIQARRAASAVNMGHAIDAFFGSSD